MSAETVRPIYTFPYVYDIEEDILRHICYFIDQDRIWEHAARYMGYSEGEITVSVYCIPINFHFKKILSDAVHPTECKFHFILTRRKQISTLVKNNFIFMIK